MIRLRPTKQLCNIYKNIDFDILEQICNTLYSAIVKKKKDYKIYIRCVDGDECLFFATKKRNFINITKNLKSDVTFIKYFLHEFRHFLQLKTLKIKFNKKTYDDKDYESYFNSPVEVDVRFFLRKHLRDFCKMYGNILKYKNQISKTECVTKFTGFKK